MNSTSTQASGPGAAGEDEAIRALNLPDLDHFMRRIFELAPSVEPGAPPDQKAAQALLRRDYDTAFNLLQRASEAFPVLMGRCQRLEAELHQVRAQSQADVDAAHGVTEQWHQLALVLKGKLEDNERQLAALRQRLDRAEADIAAGRRQLEDAHHQATVATGITTLFHDKIVEAFGVGSQAHSALDLIAKGTLGPQETTAPRRLPRTGD